MSRWKQWVKQPKGALPGGIVTKAGIVLIAVLVGGMLFSSSLTGPEEDATAAGAPPEARAVDDRAGRAFEGRLRAEAERQTQQAAANEARAEQERRQAAAARDAARADTETGPGGGAVGMAQAESELREALRLEEIERRTRSLRSLPVARSYRDPNEASGGEAGDGSDLESEFPEVALEAALASFERSVAALEGEIEAGFEAGNFSPARRELHARTFLARPARRSRAGASGPRTRRAGSGSTRARSSRPCC